MSTILIIEDEKPISDIIKFNLQKEGFDILTAYDGKEGLEMALSANPDLILLDIMLPGMNGFDVCKKIRDIKCSYNNGYGKGRGSGQDTRARIWRR